MVLSRLLRHGLFFLLPLALFSPALHGSTIAGTVKDSSGALIPHARVEIRGAGVEQPVITTSDGLGHFVSPDLKPGTYSLRVSAEGFETLERNVELTNTPLAVDLELSIA